MHNNQQNLISRKGRHIEKTFKFKQKLSEEIFEKKYNLHNEESANHIFMSIAEQIASKEKKKVKKHWIDKFYKMLSDSLFFGAGRVTANARVFSKVRNFNNCFVINMDDSIDSITDAVKEFMVIQKNGGGVGFSLSKLRPKDAKISKGGTSTGPLSFARIFNTCSETIKGGGGRRAANMISMVVSHPDIREFITIKQGDINKELTNANLSVEVTNKFMEAVETNGMFDLEFEGKVYETIKARELYDLITLNSFWNADPGILFVDIINKYHNLNYFQEINTTNPCLAKGSLVDIANGQIKIEDLKIGDIISTLHESGQEPIDEIEIHDNVQTYAVYFADGTVEYPTGDHIYWTLTEKEKTTLSWNKEKRLKDVKVGEYIARKVNDSLDILPLQITNIKPHIITTVYDLYCKGSDTWITNGHVQRGCGEQPLPAYILEGKKYYGSCNLGSLVLHSYVNDPFTDNASIDYDKLKLGVQLGVRFLDNVIDNMDAPLEAITNEMLAVRRIGLGITAWGNMLTMLKIPYGGEESLKLGDKLSKFIMNESYRASVEIAKEKGSFPFLDKFGRDKYLKSEFIKKLDKDIQKDIKKYGIRNSVILSIAPTGTMSLTLGQNCSGGIEPAFALEYNRTIRTSVGDETVTEKVFDYAWLKYLEVMGLEGQDNVPIPDYFTTSMDVDPFRKVDMIATWQNHIDTAISNTTNLPGDFKYEDYQDLFMYAYDKQLKGLTAYWPNGNLAPILSVNDKEKDDGRPTNIVRSLAPKRPKELDCDIHRIKVKEDNFIVIIGRLPDGSIYEVFADNDSHTIGNIKQGKTVRVSQGKYQLQNEDGEVLVDNLGKTFHETYKTISVLASGGLRHGIDLQFLVTQLQKGESFMSFEKAISRVLKKYIKDGEKLKISKSVCDQCGSSHWVFQSGCVTCMDCGHSACN